MNQERQIVTTIIKVAQKVADSYATRSKATDEQGQAESMPNTITIKRRIKSVRSTRQITKAMELVSASKMRRAQERAKQSRDYREAAYSILARLSSLQEVKTHPLFEQRQVSSKLYIVVTSNSGLSWSL